jgi:hypothetical protein
MQRRVLERVGLEDHALVIARTCDAIHLQTVRFQQVQTMLTCQTHDFARAVVVFNAVRHVQHTGGNTHTQCLEHRVAADHQIVGVRREMCGATACG